MAGCIPCFVIPLLLFIFHRYIQPILLKFWNPWEKKLEDKDQADTDKNTEVAKPQSLLNWSCPCANKSKDGIDDGGTMECKLKTN